jgi:hypothetical protein
MDFLFGWLTDWIKQGLIDGIMGQYAGIYDAINSKVVEIAADVGQTPQSFHGGVFSMIRSLSDTAIIPIAGMILTFVLCYELISMIIERNNMHEFEPTALYKWIFKTFVAVFIMTHVFDIVMAVFDLAQNVINTSAGVITGSLEVDGAAAIAHLEGLLQDMGIWELIGLWLETNILHLCITAISICIFLIIYGRMLEIYLTVSVAPIPFATMANKEWGQIGNNYLKSLFALAFQGFLILTCVAIYAALVQNIPTADSVHAAIWGTAGYTILLCFALFKTGSLSKSLFSAH